VLALLATCAVVAAGCGGEGAGNEADTTGSAWTLPNADASNTRFARGPIDSSTVRRLRVAWRLPLTAGYATTPVVQDGVAYIQDLDSDVQAIELKTGHVRWTAHFHDPNVGPNGVTLGDGRVYGATNTNVFALDPTSGKRLWSRRIVRNRAEAIDMAPGYANGTVYVSPAVRTPGSAGVLWALDAATGRPRWRWAEVPASLWGHPKVNAGGGLWHPPSFDGDGNLYVGVANPLPFLGTQAYPWGSSRPGPNRWNNSIVKLNATTGKFVWGRQVLPHDVYDWDLEAPVILARPGGRPIALASGKMGIVYAFDAQSGELLWRRSVGLHNGHDRDNLLAMRGDTGQLRFPLRVLPGDWGGVQTPMASDGTTVYVPVNNLYVVYHAQRQSERQDLMQGTGEIVALDIATGRVRWVRRLPHSTYGAATVSNDVVFTTTFEGTVWGISTRTGEVLWRAALPAATNAPVGVAGDTLLAAGSLPYVEGQQPAIVAYRLER
jgi:outer membrane protein assembly factor BamB